MSSANTDSSRCRIYSLFVHAVQNGECMCSEVMLNYHLTLSALLLFSCFTYTPRLAPVLGTKIKIIVFLCCLVINTKSVYKT